MYVLYVKNVLFFVMYIISKRTSLLNLQHFVTYGDFVSLGVFHNNIQDAIICVAGVMLG
jgi:hypothetical protein